MDVVPSSEVWIVSAPPATKSPSSALAEFGGVAHDGLYSSPAQQLGDKQELGIQILLCRRLVDYGDHLQRRVCALHSPLSHQRIEQRVFRHNAAGSRVVGCVLAAAQRLKAP